MSVLFMLALVAFIGFAIASVVGFVFFLLKLAFWVVLFPFKLLFKLLWLPVGFALSAGGFVLGSIALPVVLVVGGGAAVIALIAVVASVLLPLLPVVLLGLALWAIFRPRTAAV